MHTTISYIEPSFNGDIHHAEVAAEDAEGHIYALQKQGWVVLGTIENWPIIVPPLHNHHVRRYHRTMRVRAACDDNGVERTC